jgi:hypothetical protein
MTSEKTKPPENKKNLKENFSLLVKSASILYLLSISLSLSIFINLLTPQGRENYFIFFQVPGFVSIAQGYLILSTLSILILLGSIGSYLKWKFAIVLLTCSWGFLAVGVRLWNIIWLPTINFGFPVSFGFFGSLIYVKLNLGALLFFTWSLSLLIKTKTTGFLTRVSS